MIIRNLLVVMANKLTKKEKGFAKDYLETGNGTQSALSNYDTEDENTAASIASENLRKPKIIEYLESKAEKAVENIYNLANTAENEAVKLNANKDILDRAGYKAVERTVNLNVEANIIDPKARKLAEKYESELKNNL